jgi:hypothetical protein
MTTSIIVAAAQGGGSIPTPITVLLVLAGVLYVMWRRLRGESLQAKRLLALPIVFSVLGILDLTASGARRGPYSVAFLVAGSLISFVLGAARGASIELFSRGGHLWQRYRGVTVALWGAVIASKLVLALVAHLVGAPAVTDLMLSLGLSLAGEAALVAPRALFTGVPFAPDPTRSNGDRTMGLGVDRFSAGGAIGRTSLDRGWNNRASMPTSSCDGNEPTDVRPGESSTWRRGLDWLQHQVERHEGSDWSR